jgi:hypothetical protein
MTGNKLIGKTVDIKPNQEQYAGHWGVVIAFDGDRYTISGGSIGTLGPIFDRSEFTVRKPKAKQARNL